MCRNHFNHLRFIFICYIVFVSNKNWTSSDILYHLAHFMILSFEIILLFMKLLTTIIIEEIHWHWLGHVLQITDDSLLPDISLSWTSQRNRSKDRPKRRRTTERMMAVDAGLRKSLKSFFFYLHTGD